MTFMLLGLGILLAFVYGSTKVRDEVCFAFNVSYGAELDFIVFVLALIFLTYGVGFEIAMVGLVIIHFARERI